MSTERDLEMERCSGERNSLEAKPRFSEKRPLERIILRGDEAAYFLKSGSFPYVDDTAQAGATGIHIWFWGEKFRSISGSFIPYCRDRNIQIHLGIGVGAYGVEEGKDPTNPGVQNRIFNHIQKALEDFDVAGFEFQTGEYDGMEYRGKSTAGHSLPRQIIHQLNPVIDFTLKQNPDLWLRTELNADHFDEKDIRELASGLDRRCTVEWSRFTGPYLGDDAFVKARRLLELDERSSWFLKIRYHRDYHWKELAKDMSREQLLRWTDHWRNWVALLSEFGRKTLTICNVAREYDAQSLPHLFAGVMMAKDPCLPSEDVYRRCFARGAP